VSSTSREQHFAIQGRTIYSTFSLFIEKISQFGAYEGDFSLIVEIFIISWKDNFLKSHYTPNAIKRAPIGACN
jgi:hypothetical protein